MTTQLKSLNIMNWILPLLAGLLVTAGAFSLWYHAGSGGIPRFWKGFYLLVLPAETSSDVAVRALEKFGVSGIVYSGNAEAGYMAIPDIALLTPDTLDRHLIPGDPRRDPFLSGLPALFSADGMSILYLPATRSLGEYRQLVALTPELDGAGLPDHRPWEGMAGIVSFVLFAAAGLILDSRRRIARFAAVIPWFFAVVYTGGGLAPAAALAWLMPISRLWGNQTAEPGWRRWTIRGSTAVAWAAVFTAAVVARHPGTSPWWPVAVVALAAVVSEALRRGFQKTRGGFLSRRDKRDHLLFNPVPLVILTPPSAGRRPRGSAANLSWLFLIFPLFVGTMGIRYRLEVPLPAAGDPLGSFGSLPVYRELFEGHGPSSLPDISGMMASRVGQDSFLYGGTYRIPDPGEVVSLSAYRRNGNRIDPGSRDIIVYNDDWLLGFEKELEESSLGGLFRAQGGPAPVSRIDTIPVIPPIPVWMAVAMAAVALAGGLVTPALISSLMSGLPRGRRAKNNERRKRQAA